jgi:hypothetical protein
MANLFFIQSPLQLLVAQQIIRQEHLQDNVMLYGYIEENVHFLNIYELMEMKQLWDAKVRMPQVSRWAVISRKHLIHDSIQTYKNYSFIRRIISEYSIVTLYLGDVNNMSCWLAAMSFHSRGLKIVFFEEGCGHYLLNRDNGKSGNLFDRLYAVLIDALYYRPLFRCKLGYYVYWKGFRVEDLPIDVRYSIVPYYHETFDRLLEVQPMFSEKLRAFLCEETKLINTQKSVLFLTSPLYCDGINDNPSPYIKTIIDYALSLEKEVVLHIKFHPREFDSVKVAILTKLDELKVNCVIIGERVSIPVEYYLQFLKYDKVVTFICSTEYYNGYLYPKTQFESVLEDYYNNCVEEGLTHLESIKALISEHPSK